MFLRECVRVDACCCGVGGLVWVGGGGGGWVRWCGLVGVCVGACGGGGVGASVCVCVCV